MEVVGSRPISSHFPAPSLGRRRRARIGPSLGTGHSYRSRDGLRDHPVKTVGMNKSSNAPSPPGDDQWSDFGKEVKSIKPSTDPLKTWSNRSCRLPAPHSSHRQTQTSYHDGRSSTRQKLTHFEVDRLNTVTEVFKRFKSSKTEGSK